MAGVLETIGMANQAVSGIGGIVSGLGSIFGGGNDSGHDMRRAMRLQRAWQVSDRERQYTDTVTALAAANLNPALAYGGFGGNHPNMGEMPKPVYPQDEKFLRASTAREGMLASAQVEKLRADTLSSESQAALNTALATKARADTELSVHSAMESSTRADVNRTSQLVMEYTMQHLSAQTSLSYVEASKVNQEIYNAMEQNKLIQANTGNVKVDTALKIAQEAQTRVLERKAKLEALKLDQEINFNILDLPRREADSRFWNSRYGMELAPYVNSASKLGVEDVPKGEFLKSYKSR